MDYSFSLEWDEIDSDCRESKIDAMIEYDFRNSNLLDDDGEPLYADIEEALESVDLRRSTEDHIRNYFPMYF